MSIQVMAPYGYMQMRAGLIYWTLRSCPIRKRVLLVCMHDIDRTKKNAPRKRWCELAIVPRAMYEAGLVPQAGRPPAIQPVTALAMLPPWLHDVENEKFESDPRWSEPSRASVLSPREYAEARVQAITPALRAIQEIFLADDPDRELNRIARAGGQHETRFRTWFYSYVACEYLLWSLLPPRTEWGKWDRLDQKYEGTSLGRKSEHLEDMFAGRTSQDMIDKILKGFRKYAKHCPNLVETWAATVRKIFKGQTIRKPGEKPVAYHPEDKPLPSYNRFYYYIHRDIGASRVRAVLYSANRVRYEEGPSNGSLMDDLDNVGERAHYDACKVVDYPKSYIGEYHLSALYKVDMVDGVTGRIDGVGFSLGSEDARAYRLTLFCAAIKKSKFGEIIGYPIDDADWDGEGLPASLFADRGPGICDEIERCLAKWPVNLERSPSYTPQANATTEAKHQRKKRRQGAPTHRVSDLNVVELIKREVRRVIRQNRSSDVSGRASDRAVVEGRVNSPNELHAYLLSRHRSSLIHISFEEAVRAFLDPVKVVAKKGKLYFKGRQYTSEHVFSSGLAKHIAHSENVELDGYVYQLVTRLIWIDFKGGLVEARSQQPGADSLASVPELEHIQATKSKASGRRQAQHHIEVLAAQQEFFDETGKESFAGRTRNGRPNVKTKAALDEVKRIKAMT